MYNVVAYTDYFDLRHEPEELTFNDLEKAFNGARELASSRCYNKIFIVTIFVICF